MFYEMKTSYKANLTFIVEMVSSHFGEIIHTHTHTKTVGGGWKVAELFYDIK